MNQAIHFPPGHHYECTECGKCCVVPWRVKVDAAKAESIRAMESYRAQVRQGYQPLVVLDDAFELQRREDLSCFFLNDGLCEIHKEGGVGAKPAVCRLYPFWLVATVDGYYASLAFTCPAVISGNGPPVETHSSDLTSTVKDAPHFFPTELEPGRSITLTHQSRIDWAEYLAFEGSLREMVDRETDQVGVLLKAASAALVMSATGAPLQLEGSELHLLVFEQLQQMLPLFVINSLASIEEKQDPDARPALAQQIATEGYLSKLAGHTLPPYQPHCQLDHLTRDVLKRYVTNKIWGKTLITGPTMTARVLLLVVCLEVFQYFYSSLGTVTNQRHFSLELAERCFDLVETDLLVHFELVLPLMEEWERVGLQMLQPSA